MPNRVAVPAVRDTPCRALWPEAFEPPLLDAATAFLAELARSGSAREFGIGTGRVAIPLLLQGVPVHGIELSPAMVAELQRQPHASNIDVTIGDFATTNLNSMFRVVYLLRNTITNLTTQAEQVQCFANAARHLEPGGLFVIEPRRLGAGCCRGTQRRASSFP